MNDKKIIKLKTERNVKHKQIKLLNKEEYIEPEVSYREANLCFGSVWGVEDKSVPFDNFRNEIDIKNSLRPTVVIETPQNWESYNVVSVAPGTSKNHKNTKDFPVYDECINTTNPSLRTYFLLYLKWNSVQKNLVKKFYTLDVPQSNRLKNLLKTIK